MPIYEYKCGRCGHEFEHLAKRIAAPAPACPRCGAQNPTRLLSVFSAVKGEANSRRDFCAGGACPSASTCCSGTCPMND